MKSVAKAGAPTERQLSLDFEGRTVAGQKKIRARVPRVGKAPAGIDIPEKPKG
jgi:hypothetical protein